MAGQLVGGSFLSAFLQVLFDRMASREVVDFFKSQKLKDHQVLLLLNKLNATMISVNGVLDDAEEKQNTRPSVKKWLDELKDAVYEADDLLDEIAYSALRSKLLEAGPQKMMLSSKAQVRQFLSAYSPFKKGMEKAKLEEILERLEYLVKQKDALGLREGIGEKPFLQKIPTTSLVDASGGVYGRDDDMEAIVKLLLSDDMNGNDLGVIPVVGMGGIGKTTLAQLVYNDGRVQKWFDLKAWVCVSEEFDVFNVTRDILKEVTSMTCDAKTPNQLQVELKEKLMGKKLLLVLDDVWNDKYVDWDILQRPLKFLARGSKVVVTTRNESVAMVMRPAPIYYLKELTNDNCWFLFAKHAFDDGNYSAYPDLEVYGREIVRKCRGLPLAAKIIGGLLSSKRDAQEWEKISKSNIWDLSNDNILPALRLSYHYLPSHLKQCFAYCAIFPKDYEFEKEELILLWMAEGFLATNEKGKEMEEIGEKYFHDLLSRSFFQQSSSLASHYMMHDLINDLATFVSGEFCFRFEGDHSGGISKRTRHLSFTRTKHDDSEKFEAITEAKFLRTFLPISLSSGHIDNEVLHAILPQLERLRVLSLSKYANLIGLPDSIRNSKHLRYLNLSRTSIKSLPEVVCDLFHLQVLILRGCNDFVVLPQSIGNLKQLRHLNLHETSIQRLPESLTSLCDLQTLILHGCKYLVELPTDMTRLINLCHLDIRGTKLQEMPTNMGKLEKLQLLTDFVLGNESCSCIKELGELQNLQGELYIWNLQNVDDTRDASEANLKSKKHLKKLKLKWDGETRNSQHERDVLEQLQPHTNLECLSIAGYGSTRFPDWLGEVSYSNLISLKLSDCKYCLCLPPLGQLVSLKQLIIRAFNGVTVIGPEFYGSCSSTKSPFGSLEVLRFERMPQWRKWVSYANEDGFEAFPRLRELYIRKCPSFTGDLPCNMPSLTTVIIEECQQLVTSLPSSPSVLKLKIVDDSRDVMLEKLPSGLHCFRVDRFDGSNSLLDGMMQSLSSTLEEIEIRDYESLKCIPLELFPKLKTVQLTKCPNLEYLSASEGIRSGFQSLVSLEIKDCPNLVSFPEGGLPASNLTQLRLRGCSSLKSLPDKMHSLLLCLVSLKIDNCPELGSFPDGGLPSKLELLEVCSCNKLIAACTRWNLQALACLSHFKIGMNKYVESFPEETLLPSSLTSLTISNLQNLKYLDSRGFQQLTSLRELTIIHCPKLQCMPEDGLPSSLFSLIVYNCPLLEKRCQQDKGEDWPKIAGIPHIEINLPKVN